MRNYRVLGSIRGVQKVDGKEAVSHISRIKSKTILQITQVIHSRFKVLLKRDTNAYKRSLSLGRNNYSGATGIIKLR